MKREKATIGARFVGYILDSVVITAIAFGSVVFFSILVRESRLGPVYGALVGGTLNAAYSIVPHALFGRTLGKLVAGTIVLGANELPIGFGHAILRYLPYLIPMLATVVDLPGSSGQVSATSIVTVFIWAFGLVDAVWLIFNPERRALHDYLGDTVVYRYK